MKILSKFKIAVILYAISIGLISIVPGFAESPGPDQIEQVTVTAQGTPENQQVVPISITDVTAETAVKQGALKTDDLTASVPGLLYFHEANGATPFIRGIGANSDGIGEENSVATYIDDLYIPQSAAAIFPLNDIEGIDVLKGPQGTLFGRNATGGVIQVHTRDPSFTPSTNIEVGYANYMTASADGYVTGGITDNLAANLAIYGSKQQNGWGHDVTTGAQAFTAEDWGIRNKWLFRPAPSTTVLLALSHDYVRSEVGMGFNQVQGYTAAGGSGGGGATYVGWYNTQDAQNDVGVNRHDAAELRVDQELPFAKVVSISGWQQTSGFARVDQDASSLGLTEVNLGEAGRDYSQEIQLLSPDGAGYASWLKWAVGGFFLHDRSGYLNATLRGASLGFPLQSTPASSYIDLTDNVTTVSYAEYAQATIDVYPGVGLTLGGRYTTDTRIFSGGLSLSPALGGGAITNTTPSDLGATHTWGMATYRAALTYDLMDDVMSYVSYNRGVKSGQYDTFGTAASGPIADPPVNPEIVKASEVGLKSEFLDHSLRLNADVFHYDISNLQFEVLVPGGTQLINAAGATENGGELEFIMIPITNLTLSGGISVLSGQYTSFPIAPANFLGTSFQTACVPPNPLPKNYPANSCNAAHSPMIRTPPFAGRIASDYLISSAVGNFDVNVNYAYTDPFQWEPDGSLEQPVTNLVNSSILWNVATDKYGVRLWANNLLGARYYSFGLETFGYGKQFSPAAPRTFGITLSVAS
jgi:iron complex outermembrane recepter protein